MIQLKIRAKTALIEGARNASNVGQEIFHAGEVNLGEVGSALSLQLLGLSIYCSQRGDDSVAKGGLHPCEGRPKLKPLQLV